MRSKHKKSYSITTSVLAYTGEAVNKINLSDSLKFKGSISSYIQILLKKQIAKHGDMYIVSKQFKASHQAFHKGDYIVFSKQPSEKHITITIINRSK